VQRATKGRSYTLSSQGPGTGYAILVSRGPPLLLLDPNQQIPRSFRVFVAFTARNSNSFAYEKRLISALCRADDGIRTRDPHRA
jgi:hypothetical protein